ncbi:hypothetical protein [Leptospira meyeri]|uniref:hypothetical protein n=1 Tax=Leptospira meyeri TaxID=29508 RepID=UPI001083756D|nr:hypothetical protein [Leptospira meyeri]TGL13511.1 hypothetical protein EHQ50_08500 [Leptospira meyeri]
MATLKEILALGIDEYAAEIASKSESVTENSNPFNSGEPFETQIERFNNFSQSEDDAKAILKDAQKFL